MSDFIIIDGDQVLFKPTFGNATVVVKPGKIAGTGDATYGGKKVCIVGDEQEVKVENVPYISPPYTGGKGTLKIDELAKEQVATHTNTKGTRVILLGKNFQAKFEVTDKGKNPQGVPDPKNVYKGGTGQFKTNNTKFKGT